jgi:YD repeat-containing protein
VTDPAGNTTSTTYDALGNVLTRTDANGNTTTATYDVLYRPHIITDANGNSTTNAYDAAGNLISVTDALGNTTTYTYDALNRRTAVTDPLGHTTYTSYDSLGNLLETTDANGVVTRYEYDALNRQTAVILNYKPGFPADAETNVRYEFAYNAVGNRTSVKDPNGNVTTYGYDALNRVTSKSDPLTNTWSYTYDLAGNRITAIDAKGQTIQYTYDAAGQLTGIDYPGTEPDVTFSYDMTGQRVSMTDGLGTTTWTYDTMNRPTSVTDPLNNMILYDYDAVGNRTELTYPDGKTVTYDYDDVNQLTSVTDWDNQSTSYAYDDVGQVTSVFLPNGVASQYSYDSAGRLTALQHNLGANSLAAYTYAYDPVGNRTQATENILLPSSPPTPTPTATATETPVNTATPTPPPTGNTEINIGETYVMYYDDSGNGDYLVAQHTTLSQEGTIQSLSFYVTEAMGKLRLGLYNDNTGNPGSLVATTDEFTPVAGWNTQNVQSPVLLPPGEYWLAFLPESNDLHAPYGWPGLGQNIGRFYSYAYGEMPSTFSSSAWSGNFQFSLYATFTVSAEPGTIYAGEINVLHAPMNGAGNSLIAQRVELPNSAMAQSLTFYVTNAIGKLRLGIYDNGYDGPGTLLAQTDEFTSTLGWNTVNLQTQVPLAAGTYWLAFLPESNDLEFKYEWIPGLYTGRVYGYPFGELPAQVSAQGIGVEYRFSFYATLIADDSISFPNTAILDDFNRADGPIGGNWSGSLSNFQIQDNMLAPLYPGSYIGLLWNESFGADQEAYLTIPSISTAEWIGLSLKAQSGGNGIDVLYSEESHVLDVYYGNDGVYTTLAVIPYDLQDGDQLGARVDANGLLTIYVNGSLVSTLNASGYQYNAQGGQIGLYIEQYAANTTRLDNFGGGNVFSGEMLMLSGSRRVGNTSTAVSSEFVLVGSQFNAPAELDSALVQGAPAEPGQKASLILPPAGSASLYAGLPPRSKALWADGTIQVLFDVAGRRIQLVKYDSQRGWMQSGKDISVRFKDGDRFRVFLRADGTLEIHRNGKLLTRQKLSSLLPLCVYNSETTPPNNLECRAEEKKRCLRTQMVM